MANPGGSKKFIFRNGLTFIGTIIVLFSLWVLWMVWNFEDMGVDHRGISPAFFPYMLGTILLVLSLVLVQRGIKKEPEPVFCFSLNCVAFYRMVFVFGIVLAFSLVMKYTGFVPAAIVFIAIVQYSLGERKKWFIAVNSVIVPIIMYIIFAMLFRVPLPTPFWMS
jgi:hypothetical protein